MILREPFRSKPERSHALTSDRNERSVVATLHSVGTKRKFSIAEKLDTNAQYRKILWRQHVPPIIAFIAGSDTANIAGASVQHAASHFAACAGRISFFAS
jgi:hypothetical protein